MNTVLRTATALLATAFCAAGTAFAQVKFDEGTHYKRLGKAQPVETGAKVEVIEFFSFGCGHCKAFEPFLQDWMKKAPADAQVRRIPAVFQPGWKELGKVYYTLEALGEADKLAPAVFEAIHTDGKRLEKSDVFFAWAASKGLDAAKVKSTYDGFSVDGKLRRAEQLSRAYDVQFVPNIYVDGKYQILADKLTGQLAGVPAAMDYLIGVARKERK
jgi:protein dithiol oxidoreductase (disulfide-forming)